jgi:hypothetical protein
VGPENVKLSARTQRDRAGIPALTALHGHLSVPGVRFRGRLCATASRDRRVRTRAALTLAWDEKQHARLAEHECCASATRSPRAGTDLTPMRGPQAVDARVPGGPRSFGENTRASPQSENTIGDPVIASSSGRSALRLPAPRKFARQDWHVERLPRRFPKRDRFPRPGAERARSRIRPGKHGMASVMPLPHKSI